MTCDTPFGLEWCVFVRERPLLICMALDAPGICSYGQSGLLEFKTTVGIVAIAAFHHSFEDFVMKRLVKIGLDFTMAADTKLRLSKLQQMNS